MRRAVFGGVLSFVTLLSCADGPVRSAPEAPAECVDLDGDGLGANCPAGEDCEDEDPAIGTECPDCAVTPTATGCPCDDSEPRICYSGPETTQGVGPCRTGLRECRTNEPDGADPDAGTWGPCVGEIVPRPESDFGRNGIDDDCNGLVDDDLCADAEECGGNCCLPGELCLGAVCVDPGSCADHGDCDNDTFCAGEECAPWGEGDFDEDCEEVEVPPLEEFRPQMQCEWEGDDGGIRNVIVPPVVADLDPAPDGALTPEVVFVAWGNADEETALVVIDGETCDELWRVEDPVLDYASPIAVGDMDGDSHLEIAAHRATGGIVVFDSDGDIRFDTAGPDSQWPCDPGRCILPALFANLDGEGDAEVMLGLTAFDSDGDQVWRLVSSLFPWGNVPVVADVDLDGEAEVVIGNRILDGATGVAEATFGALDNGLTAVADFDRDTDEPEIAVIAPSGARIQTIEGEVIFGPVEGLRTVDGLRDLWGGPPAVADFDGDGEPEFGAAGAEHYIVFDPDCQPGWDRDGECLSGRVDGILWEKETQDETSGATGSSVFDFDGDGVNEVAYNDECFLRIYDGRTGETRFARANSNGTGYEYPVIADADGDGQTEIVVSANVAIPDCPRTDPDTGELFVGTNAGVRIFRDAGDRWAQSRRLWNQHAYSVTNVDEEGRIPREPENNWEVAGLNNFRVNTRDDPSAVGRGMDLTAKGQPWQDHCPERVTLLAAVANRGTREAPLGIPVAFYADAPPELGGALLCETRTIGDLPPGASENVACDWLRPGAAPTDVWVRADDRDVVVECEEDNNEAVIQDVWCEGPG